MDPSPLIVLAALAAWLLWAGLAHVIMSNPRGDALTGFAIIVNLLYTRLFHGLRVEGLEHVPPRRLQPKPGLPAADRGLVVVSNHTAGIDPLLIQSACPFFIRWMMASEMRVPQMEPLWAWLEIIFVGADGTRSGASELAALKDVVRDLKAGGVIGIFPEGRLERPPRVLHPFQPGVGVIIARGGGLVLPAVITGTPYAPIAWGSLARPSRSRLRFMPPIDYAGWKADAIVADLTKRYETWTGWKTVPADPGVHTGKGD